MRWTSRDEAPPRPDLRYVGSPQRETRTGRPLTRFLGGSPLGVAVRLMLMSVLVGALMVWLDIRPPDVIANVRRFVEHIWALGFGGVREALQYLAVGAIIVIPVFLIMRLLSFRRRG